uniref:Uncharacterized protein n=1 Tax=Mus musculus TaxID=10090 RepID=Q3TRT9_MOUSE|nr:unnamed protein product [Mus musculus]BAE36937.1 unnamed protein product [Mus musculus]
MLLAAGEKVPPLCATIISTRKPPRAPQDSYCRTLGACQETDTDGRSQGPEHSSRDSVATQWHWLRKEERTSGYPGLPGQCRYHLTSMEVLLSVHEVVWTWEWDV